MLIRATPHFCTIEGSRRGGGCDCMKLAVVMVVVEVVVSKHSAVTVAAVLPRAMPCTEAETPLPVLATPQTESVLSCKLPVALAVYSKGPGFFTVGGATYKLAYPVEAATVSRISWPAPAVKTKKGGA